jgi:hypothetical protein
VSPWIVDYSNRAATAAARKPARVEYAVNVSVDPLEFALVELPSGLVVRTGSSGKALARYAFDALGADQVHSDFDLKLDEG